MQAAFLNGSFLHMIFYGHNTTKQAEIQDWYIYFYSVIMTHPLMFTYYCSARCFRAECAKILRGVSAKLHFMQFLCIAKRVTVNNVSSHHFLIHHTTDEQTAQEIF